MISSTSSSGTEPVPKNLFGYDVVNVVGRGAGSVIYAVTDPSGQLFAMKHVVKKDEKDERLLEQLVNEHEMSRLFRHPALRKAIDLKKPRKFFSNKFNEAGLVLEWVNGQPLSENVPADIHRILEIFAHCASALASIHKLRLVHCDFKPGNVLICDDGKVKLIDFGQTCKVQTAKQRVQGTPDFIAPEQYKCVAVDEKTDVYCFGASLYWALTGAKVPTYYTVDRNERDIIKMQKFPSPRDLKPAFIPGAFSLRSSCRTASCIIRIGGFQT